MMRLDKYLAERTGMTRSESRKAITKGRVMVAGKVCRKADTQLDETAADITLARLREMMLQNVNTSRAVTNRYLVDEGGRVIIGSGSGPEDETAPEDGGFRQFPNPELLRTIRDRRNGRLFVTEDGVRRLYFFQKIETVGWMYIERIDFAEMLRSKHKTTNKLSDIV